MRKFIPFFGLVLAGCSYFSPDYHKPVTQIPQNWSTRPQGIESVSESLPYLAWWQKFNDPELNRYIESGLQYNMTIQVAKANLEAAQGQLLAVKLNWIPMLNLFGGVINGSSQNSMAPIGNLGAIANSGAFFAILPSYTLNVFTNYTLQKQAGYNVEVAKNAELSVRLAVIGQVASAYFSNLAQQQLLVQFTKLYTDVGELVTIASELDKRGLTNSVSVDELKSKQLLIKGQLAIVQKNLTATQNALRLLINQTPGLTKNLNQFANINPNQIIPGNLPVSVLAARPDILKAEAQLKAANEGISVASSALLPGVNLNYFYAQGSGQQTFNNPIPNVNTENSNQQSYYAAYANWTISPSVFGTINTNSALFRASLAQYKFAVNTALHEVDNALAANNALNQKMRSDTAAYSSLESNIQVKQAMLKRGLTTYMVVKTFALEQDLLAIDLTQTKLQQLISLVNLYQSLGGGYQYNESALAESK
ncbi:MAG: TolC family protein [Burkholderiales bacterium]|nr:TolC family protein [Burkholderiales bacterium]